MSEFAPGNVESPQNQEWDYHKWAEYKLSIPGEEIENDPSQVRNIFGVKGIHLAEIDLPKRSGYDDVMLAGYVPAGQRSEFVAQNIDTSKERAAGRRLEVIDVGTHDQPIILVGPAEDFKTGRLESLKNRRGLNDDIIRLDRKSPSLLVGRHGWLPKAARQSEESKDEIGRGKPHVISREQFALEIGGGNLSIFTNSTKNDIVIRTGAGRFFVNGNTMRQNGQSERFHAVSRSAHVGAAALSGSNQSDTRVF